MYLLDMPWRSSWKRRGRMRKAVAIAFAGALVQIGTVFAVQGKDCSAGGCSFDINNFGGNVKTNLGNAQSVKSRLKKDLKYDPDTPASNPGSIPDQNAADRMNQILQSIQGASSVNFTCTEKRVISVKALYRCTWNENLFPDKTLCETRCIEEGSCKQAPCYETAYCTQLSAGYVCPIGMVQCEAIPTCPSGGTYNAQTGKCEANPL